VTDYAAFPLYYDERHAKPATPSDRVLEGIQRYMPAATSLLELGCGTGAVLAGITHLPYLAGLDRSWQMLAIASTTVPAAQLVQADMTSFTLHRRFDVVICVFNTLNHVLTFPAWEDVFRRVHDHLVAGGLFIFDVNTIGRLTHLAASPPWVRDFSGDTFIVDVTLVKPHLALWDIRIFEHRDAALYVLHHERIRELAVSIQAIKQALRDGFDLVDETDTTGAPPRDESQRGYFLYRRR
jgi:SAM-dependent methyltransferase